MVRGDKEKKKEYVQCSLLFSLADEMSAAAAVSCSLREGSVPCGPGPARAEGNVAASEQPRQVS